jgi:hypothetical protein
MIKFESQYEEGMPKVTVELHSDSTLVQVLEAFEDFLKATGYEFTGSVDILEDGI